MIPTRAMNAEMIHISGQENSFLSVHSVHIMITAANSIASCFLRTISVPNVCGSDTHSAPEKVFLIRQIHITEHCTESDLCSAFACFLHLE